MKDTASPSSRLLRGAFILVLAAVLSKLIGTVQKIPLQNIGGDGVFGIYNAVYPFYTLVLLIATAGFPAAVSRFVAEEMAAGRTGGARRVLRVSSWMLIVLGLVCGAIMYAAAPLLAAWIDNMHTEPAIRSAALALPLVPIMAGLRGYFQGMHDMMPTAVSQVAEQTIRVAAMVILLLWLHSLSASDDWIAAGATFGSAAGGAAGLLVMLIYWWLHRRRTRDNVAITLQEEQQPVWPLLKALLLYALPICLGSLSAPLISLVDTFTVPRLLKANGWTEAEAMVRFGIYNRGIPLVQLMAMLATSMSVLFIPALTDARVREQHDLIRNQTKQTVNWFWLLGLASSAGIAVLAVPIDVMLYEDAVGSDTIRWLAFTGVGATLSIVTAALLQGLGSVRAPAVHLLLSTVVKAVLNIILVPHYGINGAAIAGIVAYSLAAVLNVLLLIRITRFSVSWREMIGKPVLVTVVMCAGVLVWLMSMQLVLTGLGMHERLESLIIAGGGVVIGGALFLIGLFRTRLMTEQQAAALPKIGSRLVPLLKRMKIINR
ncbi:polysaccharide biosynthesis protein [Paenibacillus hunanensis]|uniref:putative polysaccharide biosynthesis protein n=1 Tax=Paenibacillus hunanensis TaxID=539262 RepID=UPI002A6AC0A1|nr:polysaccharide biosynthesis protein [Paenibacillus hunanensis]WPP41441.1 polysaccharide biosynthesis protein [Paenibacillus hunanensis]